MRIRIYQKIYFLHEVGHAFQMAICKDSKEVPTGVIKVFEKTFSCRWTRVNPNDISEIFADCYSVACLYETEYESEQVLIEALEK